MTLPAPSLRHVCDLSIRVSAPTEAGHTQGLSTRGMRRIIPIIGGTVRGAINGTVLQAGADFQMITSDTTADLDARYILRLDDGSHVYVHNTALRRASADDVAKLIRGDPVDPTRVYFRCVPRFEVENPALLWLTQSVFIGTATRAPDGVELSIYEVM